MHEPGQGHFPPAEPGHEMHQRLEPFVVAADRLGRGGLGIAAGSGWCADELETRQAVDCAEEASREHLSGERAPAVGSDRGTDDRHLWLCHPGPPYMSAPPGNGVPTHWVHDPVGMT